MNIRGLGAVKDTFRTLRIRLGGREVFVKDRLDELEWLVTSNATRWAISIVTGPFGSGKTTLLGGFAEALRKAREGGAPVEDFVVIYNDQSMEAVNLFAPELKGNVEVIRDFMLNIIKSINTGGIALDHLYRAFNEIVDRYRQSLEGKDVFIIYDNVDDTIRARGGQDYWPIERVIRRFAERFNGLSLNELAEGTGASTIRVFFALSDQRAITFRHIFGKGGLQGYVVWNLPKRDFTLLLDEVAPRPRLEPETMWELIGGNPRMLGRLGEAYSWDLKAWISIDVVGRVRSVIGDLAKRMNISISQVLGEVGLDKLDPDKMILETRVLKDQFIENNILMDLNQLFPATVRGGAQDVELRNYLPSEPWVGYSMRFAYQIPAYYWALRAMVRKGTVNVNADDVLGEINKY